MNVLGRPDAQYCLLDTQIPDLVLLHKQRKKNGQFKVYPFIIMNDDDISKRKPIYLIPAPTEYVKQRQKTIQDLHDKTNRQIGERIKSTYISHNNDPKVKQPKIIKEDEEEDDTYYSSDDDDEDDDEDDEFILPQDLSPPPTSHFLSAFVGQSFD